MEKRPLSINTHQPPPPSVTSTQIGEDDDPYDQLTPTSTISFFSSATTSRTASPHRHPQKIPLSLPHWKENAIPTPGKTYIITALHLPQSRPIAPSVQEQEDEQHHHTKAITLCQGQLKLLELRLANLTNGCWYWECITKDGWLGFRNVASGSYLGHDGKMGVVANAPHCKAWEWFCVRRVPFVDYLVEEKEKGRDGYVLLLRHWDKLLRVAVRSEEVKDRWGSVLVETEDKWSLTDDEKAGGIWGFIEVGPKSG
ncbi:hypothetical protein B0T21DRAFT_296456 [Apiosordaria backusii]|uniref:Uncharacterized protein n=1 Tax=Apiosordaria backusii TaxID=314023 RepID=A0AA40AJ03_9PEZI|nr:hypothetical protein B0T21DRAFT_296456 [Apiosordaria backusii]